VVADREIDSTDPFKCNVYWVDSSQIGAVLKRILPYQKINHFPGMQHVARKSLLATNLDRMRKLFPEDYDFMPRSWVLPNDLANFRKEFNPATGLSRHAFIVKPDGGCQGRGIFLTRDLADIDEATAARDATFVAQRYIARPLLLNRKKFDLRLYVLVTSVAPLRVFLFKDGLVRVATEEYQAPNASNMDERCMHLTNYAVNKRSDNYEVNTDEERCDVGSKRSLRWFVDWIEETRGPGAGRDLWKKMGDVCCKALVSALPSLVREYRLTFGKAAFTLNGGGGGGGGVAGGAGGGSSEGAGREGGGVHGDAGLNTGRRSGAGGARAGAVDSCSFQILGVDIMVDEALKPWLIEFNHLPCFNCDSPLDKSIKTALVGQTLQMVNDNVSHADRARYQTAVMENCRSRLLDRSTKGSQSSGGEEPTRPDGGRRGSGSSGEGRRGVESVIGGEGRRGIGRTRGMGSGLGSGMRSSRSGSSGSSGRSGRSGRSGSGADGMKGSGRVRGSGGGIWSSDGSNGDGCGDAGGRDSGSGRLPGGFGRGAVRPFGSDSGGRGGASTQAARGGRNGWGRKSGIADERGRRFPPGGGDLSRAMDARGGYGDCPGRYPEQPNRVRGTQAVLPGEDKLVDFERIMPPMGGGEEESYACRGALGSDRLASVESDGGRSSPTYSELADAAFGAVDASVKR
jgi:tubulin polyglutamylase TTLL6/13